MSHRRGPIPSFPDRTAPVILPGESVVNPPGVSAITVDHEVDARTAVIRGMVDHLRTLSTEDSGGRVIRFMTVVEGQAEPEEGAEFPWVSVMAPDEAPYQGGGVPMARKGDRINTPRQDFESYAVETSNFVTTLHLTFIGNKEERLHLMKMLERDLQYPDGSNQYGFKVELPCYMGRRADYAPVASQYVDSPAEAARSRFGGVMKVSASLSVARIVESRRIKGSISTSVK